MFGSFGFLPFCSYRAKKAENQSSQDYLSPTVSTYLHGEQMGRDLETRPAPLHRHAEPSGILSIIVFILSSTPIITIIVYSHRSHHALHRPPTRSSCRAGGHLPHTSAGPTNIDKLTPTHHPKILVLPSAMMVLFLVTFRAPYAFAWSLLGYEVLAFVAPSFVDKRRRC